MSEDAVLIAIVFAVWAVLAALYATVPMLHMPAAALLWGVGAVLFMALAALILAADRIARRRK
jgi:hypothetical protein